MCIARGSSACQAEKVPVPYTPSPGTLLSRIDQVNWYRNIARGTGTIFAIALFGERQLAVNVLHNPPNKSFPQELWISVWMKSPKGTLSPIKAAFSLNWLFFNQHIYLPYLQYVI